MTADTVLLPLSHFAYTVPPAWNIQPKLVPWPALLTNTTFSKKPTFVRYLPYVLLYFPSHALSVPISSLREVTVPTVFLLQPQAERNVRHMWLN